MYYFGQPILTPSQLRRLEKHKYSANSESVLDPLLQRWWNFVVTLVPMWVAPNLITMVGLIINVATSIILMWLCPTATEPAPKWPTFACALGLFAYQTLDAIDGKQARRTGSQSPLGELFDHGCDSLSTVFVTLATACAVSLGHNPAFLLLQCFTASILFYCAHWQAYVTGTMRFGRVDVTEAQFSVITVMLLTVLIGPGFWDTEFLGIELRAGPTLFGCVLSGWSLIQTLQIISNGGAGKNGSTVALFRLRYSSPFSSSPLRMRDAFFLGGAVLCAIHATDFLDSFRDPGGCGKNGSTVAGTSVITPVIPIFLVVLPGLLIASNSSENVFEENPILFVVTWGIMAAKVTNRLIVAHMSKSELSSFDVTMLTPAAFLVRSYCHLGAIISEKQLLVLACAFVTIDIIFYCRAVCLEICDHLKVELFRIKPSPPPKATRKNSK